MRYIVICLIIIGLSNHSVQAKSFVGDTVQVRFQRDTIRLLEGESQIITVELQGEIPKDSFVEVKWSIKDSDGIIDKDFQIFGEEKFIFTNHKNKLQEKYFRISAIKDENIEKEKIVVELSLKTHEKVISKVSTKECVIFLMDFKTEVEILKEKLVVTEKEFSHEKKELTDSIINLINNDKEIPQEIGSIWIKRDILKVHSWPESTSNKGYKEDSIPRSSKKMQNVSKRDSLQSLGPTVKDTAKNTVEVSNVEIQFKYGLATEIRAFSKDSSEVFSNHWYNANTKTRPRYGVSFRHNTLSDRNKKYYLIGEKDSKTYIKLSDLIDYRHRTGLNFVPNDTIINLFNQKGKEIANLSVKTSLNSYINFNIYTDILGLLKIDQSNGLIQSDASAKIFLTTLPAKNKIRFHFNYLLPYLKYSRFENGFQNVPTIENKSFSINKSDTINRMLLNQRKFFDTGLKLNILNRIGRFDNTYELNVFSGFGWFNRQGPIDSVQTQKLGYSQYQGILTNSFEFGLETRASILQYHNFGINVGLMTTCQRIMNDKVNNISDAGFRFFYRTESEIFYYPIAKSQDKIFLRTYYTFNGNPKEESFLRIQVGYKALFQLNNKK